MIEISAQKNGTMTICPSPDHPEAREWLEELFSGDYLSSTSSDRSILPPPSSDEEINEEWEEYVVPDLVSALASLRRKFRGPAGSLVFDHSSVTELAAFLNQARVKIAADGTSDLLPPSGANPRRLQYEFYTALLEVILQIARLARVEG